MSTFKESTEINNNETINDKIKGFDKILQLFESASVGLWEMDSNGMINFFNKSFYKKYNINLENSDLIEWTSIIHPEDQKQFGSNVELQINDNISDFISEYRVMMKNGNYAWIEGRGLGRYDDHNNLLYMVGSHTDITAKKLYESDLYNLAYTDNLTKMSNRARLVDRLSHDYGATGSFTYLNFDNLALINDKYGYEFGNEIILILSNKIKRVFKDDFEHFRIGPSEFALLTKKDFCKDELTSYMHVLNQLLNDKLIATGKSIEIRLSAGICMINEEITDVEDLMLKARITTRYAKTNIASRCAFYDDNIQKKINRELYIRTSLIEALENNEFYLNYQPIVDTITGKINSFEALIRWESTDLGSIYPDEFIEIAEKSQDIIEIGYYVIKSACKFLNKLKKESDSIPRISVNVSVIQLLQNDFANNVIKILKEEKISPEYLNIEITESLMLDNQKSAIEQLEKLDRSGIDISLDDFGTGYSSLYNLFTLPLKKLKIDKKVMDKVMIARTIDEFVSSITLLCHKNNVILVAEGIETIEMVEKSKKIGIDLLQGYFFSKPVSEEKAIELYIKTKK